MNNKLLLFIGGLLIIFGTLNAGTTSVSYDALINLDISKPSEKMQNRFIKIRDIVSERDDKVNLCIFNKVFADRVNGYSINQQQLNDIYVNAAKNFFSSSLKGKYEDLDVFLIDTIEEVTGNDVHQLSNEEKLELQNRFYAIAWILNN